MLRWVISVGLGMAVGVGVYIMLVQDILFCCSLSVSWSILTFNFRNLVHSKARTASGLLLVITMLGVSATLEMSNEMRIALRLFTFGTGLAVISLAASAFVDRNK